MATYSTNIPGAPGYEQANLLARRAYDNAMSRLQQRRSQSLLHYGYTRDASGKLNVDPNNEYGAYQQMLRGEDQQSHALDRAQRASGWGGGGYLGQQAEDLQHAQGGDQAQLGQSFADELSGIANDEQDAAFQRDQALYQNEQEAAQRAIDQGNFNPADYSNLDVPDYGEPPKGELPPIGGRGGKGPRPKLPPRKRPPRNKQGVHQRGKARLMQRKRARAKARGRGH